MNYVYPSNAVLTSKKPINLKKKRSAALKARRKFIESHRVTLTTDPKTHQVVAKVEVQE